jgi:hypothetical protein
MLERLDMSKGERDRLHAIRNVLDGIITQVEAAEIIRRCTRQVSRLCALVRDKGDAALVHGLRGRPSNHRRDEDLLGQALSALHDPIWDGFGPAFASEQLGGLHSIRLSINTVRKLMLLTGLWQAGRRRTKHRAWRPRRPRVGMLTQLDGSPHRWLEDRGPELVLIIYIDDATSRILYGEFVDVEDTLTLMRTTAAYLRRRGRPVAFYVDKDSIYTINRPDSAETSLHEADPITQFKRAMVELGIEVILANSPQAKGRVERGFRTHQDRLIKELRLAGISTKEEANKFLLEVYIPRHNRRYAVEPAEVVDVHRPLLPSHNLGAILSIQKDRQVHQDSIVRIDNRFLLLEHGHGLRPKTKVIVQERVDGTLRITHRGRYLAFKQVPARPYVPEQLRRAAPRLPVLQPSPIGMPRNPFAGVVVGSSNPTNPPASAVLA